MLCSTWTVDSDSVRTATQAIGLGLLVLGWFLVNRQNNHREFRKETRQLIDRTREHVATAVETAAKYQSGAIEEKDRHVEGWKLLLALYQIRGSINALTKKGIDTGACAHPYIDLKICITGADFMTAEWKAWNPEDPRWLELLAASNKINDTLEHIFIERFT
jgi:hypothetical protein